MKEFAMRLLGVIVMLSVVAVGRADAQYPAQVPAQTVDLSGPRAGITFLSGDVRTRLRSDFGKNVGPVISQFGWQREKRFLSSATGVTGVTEFVFLLGGADQGILLPSLNWLVGMRTLKGVEFAVGPNVTPAGIALAAATGVTFRAGNLNVPVNFAAVRSESGLRVSMLAGFNARRP
jgi:hypothetical protein